KDGSIDIERFRIFNPPILVEDPNGDINQEWTDDDGAHHTRHLREDAKEALLQSLEQTIAVKKDQYTAENLEPGKIGNTTDTFYPAAGSNSPVDGYARNYGQSYGTVQGASTGLFAGDSETAGLCFDHSNSSGTYLIRRSFFLFDASPVS